MTGVRQVESRTDDIWQKNEKKKRMGAICKQHRVSFHAFGLAPRAAAYLCRMEKRQRFHMRESSHACLLFPNTGKNMPMAHRCITLLSGYAFHLPAEARRLNMILSGMLVKQCFFLRGVGGLSVVPLQNDTNGAPGTLQFRQEWPLPQLSEDLSIFPLHRLLASPLKCASLHRQVGRIFFLSFFFQLVQLDSI